VISATDESFEPFQRFTFAAVTKTVETVPDIQRAFWPPG